MHTGSEWETSALLNSGATGSCINKEFVEKNGLPIKELPVKLPVYNADGTLNKGGAIEGFVKVQMKIGDHAEKIELAVTNLSKTSIFLGLDWLRYHNPTINWTTSEFEFGDHCQPPVLVSDPHPRHFNIAACQIGDARSIRLISTRCVNKRLTIHTFNYVVLDIVIVCVLLFDAMSRTWDDAAQLVLLRRPH